VNEYKEPFDSPVTTHDNGFRLANVVEHVRPPGDAVTEYPVTAEPPSVAGASQYTAADDSESAAPVTVRGAPGTVRGTTGDDGDEPAPAPATFDADTVNEYDVPFDKPEHNADNPDTTHEPSAGDAATAYDNAGAPPFETGASHEITAEPFPGTAETPVGEPGIVRGTTNDDAALLADWAPSTNATTRNVYTVPLVKPDTVHENGFRSEAKVEHVAPFGDAVTR
jgi:hypothetical protein